MSAPPLTASKYRPDIDGIRALAVLSVIIYHINKHWLPGGFIGVDIFFVISGYLITHNICQLMLAGRFSLLDFYGRRAKRIAPAMLVMIACVIAISQLILLPEHAERVAESGLWAVFSAANVYFWQNLSSDYFASASAETPLLHLWSLGVEEQFYLLWPLALLLLAPLLRTRFVVWLITAAALASFVLAEALFDIAHSFSYYMLPTRAGELLMGALAAFAVINGQINGLLKRHAQALAYVGMAAVAWSLYGIRETQVFPGLVALIPTLGTALLILSASQRTTLIARFFSLQPLRWVGLISFSAYLWHWPLLAFYRYGNKTIDIPAAVVLFAASLLLGWLSYRFIEQPTRRKQWPSGIVLWRYFALPGSAVAAFALVTMYSDGYGLHSFSPRYAIALQQSRNVIHTVSSYQKVCQRWRITEQDVTGDNCVLGSSDNMAKQAPPEILLWGDSNAAHYVGVVDAFARDRKQRFRNLAHASCPPIFADPTPYIHARFRYRAADCIASIEQVKKVLPQYQVVVIGADYISYGRHSDNFAPDYFNTLKQLADMDKDIVLLGKAPVFYNYRRDCQARALRYPGLNCKAAATPLTTEIADFNASLQAFAAGRNNVHYYDINKFLCSDGLCSPYAADGSSLYYDASHLSIAASRMLGVRASVEDKGATAFTAIETLTDAAIVTK